MSNKSNPASGRYTRALRSGLALVLCLAAAPNAFAGASTWSRTVTYRLDDKVGDQTVIQDSAHDSKTVSQGSTRGSVTLMKDISSFDEGNAGTEVQTKVFAGPGAMGVAAAGNDFANTPGFGAGSVAEASATDRDTLLITNPKFAGQTLTFHSTFKLDGSGSVHTVEALSQTFPPKARDHVDSSADLFLELAGTGFGDGVTPGTLERHQWGSLNEGAGPPVDTHAPKIIDNSFQITGGVPLSIFHTLSILGIAGTSNVDDVFHRTGSASFIGDFFHTLTFMPGAFFTDAAGDVVTGVDLTSASGFDYLNPPTAGDVPEPAAWALMIAGFGLVGATLRGRPASSRCA